MPLLPEFSSRVRSIRVYAYVDLLIDGRRGLRDIARAHVDERLMMSEEAGPPVRGFLLRLHEDSISHESH